MKDQNKIAEHTPLYSIEEIMELGKEFCVNKILKQNGYQNKPLDFETAYVLGVFTLYPYSAELSKVFDIEPALAEKQSIAALCALHNTGLYKKENAAEQIAGDLIDVTQAELDLLMEACRDHSDGHLVADVTVMTCWDADRLDLGRVGIRPDPRRLCTHAARQHKLVTEVNDRALRW